MNERGRNRIRRLFAAITVTLVSVVGGAIAGGTPANAAVRGNGICEALEYCLYQHAGFKGAVYDGLVIIPNMANVSYMPLPNIRLNDSITSIRNDTPCTFLLYIHANYEGNSFHMPPYTETPNVGAAWNDKFSSLLIACPL